MGENGMLKTLCDCNGVTGDAAGGGDLMEAVICRQAEVHLNIVSTQVRRISQTWGETRSSSGDWCHLPCEIVSV